MNRSLLIAICLVMAPQLVSSEEGNRKEAEILVEILNIEPAIGQTIDVAIDSLIDENRSLEIFRNVIAEFFEMHFSSNNLKPAMIDMYAEMFTASELRDLTKFYKTPTGKKLIIKTPELLDRINELGMLKVEENFQELEFMIEAETDRIRRLQENES